MSSDDLSSAVLGSVRQATSDLTSAVLGASSAEGCERRGDGKMGPLAASAACCSSFVNSRMATRSATSSTGGSGGAGCGGDGPTPEGCGAGGVMGVGAGGLNGGMVSGRRAEGGAVHQGHHEEQEEKRGTSGGHERVCPVPVTMYL